MSMLELEDPYWVLSSDRVKIKPLEFKGDRNNLYEHKEYLGFGLRTQKPRRYLFSSWAKLPEDIRNVYSFADDREERQNYGYRRLRDSQRGFMRKLDYMLLHRAQYNGGVDA